MNQTFINSLQNTESYSDYIASYLDKSLSALANSGQRFNIKSPGIKYKNITLEEILFGTNGKLKNKLVELSIDPNKYELYYTGNDNTNNTFESIKFSNSLVLDLNKNSKLENIQYIFNHLDGFSNDSYIQINDDLLTGFLKGKLSQEENESELIYFQVRISDNNRLEHYISTKYYGKLNENETSGEYYILYKLDYIKDEQYNLSIYLFTLDFVVNEINEQLALNIPGINTDNSVFNSSYIKKFYDFNESYIDEDTNEIKIFSFINNTFIDYDKYSILTNNISELSFVNFILTHTIKAYETDFIKLNDLVITRDISNYTYSITSEITNQDGYLTSNDLRKYVIDLQNLENLYNQLYIIFNEDNYFSLNTTNHIYKHLLYSLYYNIKQHYNQQNTIQDKIYIPLRYHFNCYISDQNENLIYYIDNIYVKNFADLSYISNYDIENESLNKILYYNPNLIDHIDIYNINVNYNTILENNVINSILVNKLYTLPYINKLNNWVIDNDDTNISILNNQYTGIKQLFIYSSKTSSQSYNNEILNISDNSILSNIQYVERQFKINPNLFYIYSNIDIYCNTNIPTINSSNKDFFKNSLIISISSNDNIIENNENDSTYKDDYQLDYVYSLWKPNFETNEFDLVTLADNENSENSFAFDPFNNYEIYLRNNYKFKYINGFYTSKQDKDNQSQIITDNYIGILRNKQGYHYHSNYYNDYNFILEYLNENIINENGTKIDYSDHKFINDIKNLDITNIIYPTYQLFTVNSSKIEEIETLQNIDLDIYTAYVSIAINENNKVLIEVKNDQNRIQVLDLVKNIVSREQQVEIGIFINKTNSDNASQYFNEYIFNENIPTIDLKEVFVRNNNNLNRVNILGIGQIQNTDEQIDKENLTCLYNGYIGTNYNDTSKDVLHISTSNENINIGFDTLLNINQIDKFTRYKTLSIDGFENLEIKLKSSSSTNNQLLLQGTSSNLITYKPVINQITPDIYSSSNILVGECSHILLVHLNPSENNTSYTLSNLSIDDTFDNTTTSFTNVMFLPLVVEFHEVNGISSYNYQYKTIYNTINLNRYILNVFNIDISTNDYLFNLDEKSNIIKLKDGNKTLYLLIVNDNKLSQVEKTYLSSDSLYLKENNQEYTNFKNGLFDSYYIYNYYLNITVNKTKNTIDINFENNHRTDLLIDSQLSNIINPFLEKFQNQEINFILDGNTYILS